jgi:hypothetical protein
VASDDARAVRAKRVHLACGDFQDRPQLLNWGSNGGCQQRGGAVLGMEGRCPSMRVRGAHGKVGAVPAVNMKIDKPREYPASAGVDVRFIAWICATHKRSARVPHLTPNVARFHCADAAGSHQEVAMHDPARNNNPRVANSQESGVLKVDHAS